MKRRKITITALFILLTFLLGCSISPTVSNTEPASGPRINWEMNGTFVCADGTFAEKDISVTGHIRTAQDETDTLDIEITSDAEFPYLFSKPEPHYISTNRKHNDMAYLLTCYAYTYNRQTNKSTRTVFALDTEKEYFIVLFADMPNCYYVAATKENVTREELVTHFSDFLEAYSADVWG